jgi:RNA polymerase sigma-70 factor (ECF subfamily)
MEHEPSLTQPSRSAGDSATEVQRLFLRHTGAIKGFILALLRDRTLAEDVLQETYLVVSAKAPQFRPDTNFVAWACTIARFKVLEAIRRHSRENSSLRPEVIEALTADLPIEDDRDQQLLRLETCVDELPSSARNVIRLRYFHALSTDEIARRLTLGVASVHVTLSRARRALRQCVELKTARAS